ncbi:MAG: 4Fe-4S binding protein [Coriobacteriaceae bacterium]|nr:4Fe-4S binding protein [Coriobacteriaceae bacterium]
MSAEEADTTQKDTSTEPAAPKKRGMRAINARTLTELALVVLACVGLAFATGTGTPSSWGLGTFILTVCPLGAIETMLASKTFIPPALIGLAVIVVITLIIGRAFCSWGCPVPLLRRIFGANRKKQPKEGEGGDAKAKKAKKPRKDHLSCLDTVLQHRGGITDSRNWVLIGALISCLIFGFPVFCLICPVGLSFATITLIWRLFQFNEVTWTLLLFPAILVVELVFMRKWCHRFCPIGALLSLISRLNRTFRPKANETTCLYTKDGIDCHRCSEACPEGIDLRRTELSAPMHECLKCRECADACPTKSITFPLLGGGNGGSQEAKQVQRET